MFKPSANILSKSRKIQNSIRLFFFLKVGGKPFMTRKEIVLASKEGAYVFTRHNINSGLEMLKSLDLISISKGVIYLRSSQKLFTEILGIKKTSRRIKFDVPQSALLTERAWRQFLCGSAIVAIAKKTGRVPARRRNVLLLSACRNGAGQTWNRSVPVSAEIIARNIDRSIATASRIRKIAGSSGMCAVVPQKIEVSPVGKRFTYTEAMGYRAFVCEEYGSKEASKITFKRGRVWFNLPHAILF